MKFECFQTIKNKEYNYSFQNILIAKTIIKTNFIYFERLLSTKKR